MTNLTPRVEMQRMLLQLYMIGGLDLVGAVTLVLNRLTDPLLRGMEFSERLWKTIAEEFGLTEAQVIHAIGPAVSMGYLSKDHPPVILGNGGVN